MNYRELQSAIKQFRIDGLTDKSFKLNQKKTILMEEYERVINLNTPLDSKVDVRPDKSTDKDLISVLQLRIAELEQENDKLRTKIEHYKTKLADKDYEAHDPSFDDSQRVREVRRVNIEGDLKGSILDVLSDGTAERVEKERHHLEKLINTAEQGDSETVKPEIEYEIIECENGVIIERDIITPINTNEDTHNIDEVPDLDDDEYILLDALRYVNEDGDHQNYIPLTPVRKLAGLERDVFDATLWKLQRKGIIDQIDPIQEGVMSTPEDWDAAIPAGEHTHYHYFYVMLNLTHNQS